MVKEPSITSLSELRKRKKELRMDMELSKREFAHSIGTNRGNISNFLVNKVALPVGGAGLGLVFLNRLLSSSGGGRDKEREVIRETKVIHQYPDGRRVAGGEAPAMQAAARPGLTRKDKKKMISIATIASLAKLIIPIVQAIIGTVTAHKAEQHAEQAKKAVKS